MPASHPIDANHLTVGIIGGGQLGRMLAMAARQMNIRTAVWTGGLEAPATEVADMVIDLPFDSQEGLSQFCKLATVATVEFENIPRSTLDAVANHIPLHPSPNAIGICQNREREKNFLKANQIPCTAFIVVSNAAELALAMEQMPGKTVLKTADFGYDGSGQIKLHGNENPELVWQQFNAPRGVLEAWVPFEREISVMAVRDANGITTTYDPAENQHRSHILDVSIVPARIPQAIAKQAEDITRKVAEALEYQGLLGVEFFLKANGELLVNEIAPRPHNSGHHTMDACVTSQFEQQLRSVIGLPAGSPKLLSPVVMLNLLGDLWPAATTPPDWLPLFADGQSSLHLYGKQKASPRRKMGHANILGASSEEALMRALSLQQRWFNEAGTKPNV